MDSVFDQAHAGLAVEEECPHMTQQPSGEVDLMADFNEADIDLAPSTNHEEEEVTEEVYMQPSSFPTSEAVPLASIGEEAGMPANSGAWATAGSVIDQPAPTRTVPPFTFGRAAPTTSGARTVPPFTFGRATTLQAGVPFSFGATTTTPTAPIAGGFGRAPEGTVSGASIEVN
jgi:hypothetical protein